MKRYPHLATQAVCAFLLAWAAEGKDLAELARGESVLVKKGALLPDSYVAFQARKLKNLQKICENKDWMDDHDYTLNSESDFADEVGYAVPEKGDPPEWFTEGEKTFWADLYGGNRIGGSKGSGRAADTGIFNIKGIGRTPNAAPKEYEDLKTAIEKKREGITFPRLSELRSAPLEKLKEYFLGIAKAIFEAVQSISHLHGAASLREAIMEMIWGEILNRELPHGANRVPAIYSTGTATHWFGPFSDERSLIVREAELRPAHYLSNSGWDSVRTRQLFRRMTEFLPKPKVSPRANPKKRIKRGIEEWARRIADTYASQYAKSFYQGSSTTSNVGLSGKALDHGPTTALDGYTAAEMSNPEPNGSMNIYLTEIIDPFLDEIRRWVPPGSDVPTKDKIASLFTARFEWRVQRDFLWLAGVPVEHLDALMLDDASVEFAGHLVDAAKLGNDKPINSRYSIPRNTGRYRIQVLLEALLSGQPLGPLMMSDPELAASLEQSFRGHRNTLQQLSTEAGFSAEALSEYRMRAVALRNRPLEDLFRGPKQWAELYALILRYKFSGDAKPIARKIDRMISRNSRTFPHTAPYTLVIEEEAIEGTGFVARKVFDMKSGSVETWVGGRASAGITGIEAKGSYEALGEASVDHWKFLRFKEMELNAIRSVNRVGSPETETKSPILEEATQIDADCFGDSLAN